jgi:hypothetical protein
MTTTDLPCVWPDITELATSVSHEGGLGGFDDDVEFFFARSHPRRSGAFASRGLKEHRRRSVHRHARPVRMCAWRTTIATGRLTMDPLPLPIR